MKWILCFGCVISLCVSALAERVYDEEGWPIDPPEMVAVMDYMTYLQKTTDLSKEDYDAIIEKMEALKKLDGEDGEYYQFFVPMEFLRMATHTGEYDENRDVVKYCIERLVELYLSGRSQSESYKYLCAFLYEFPVKLPAVEKYLRSRRHELMERFTEDLAVLYEQISQKREKTLQKDFKEWDKYYRTHFPLKIDYFAEIPEDPDAGWPKGLARTSRYPDLKRPYRVADPVEREEYIRMLPKAVAWLDLCELPDLRKDYANNEPKIYNAFAFFYDSGKSNMEELRKILNDRKISKHMQKAILEEMKKPYNASLARTLSWARYQKVWETGRDEAVPKYLP